MSASRKRSIDMSLERRDCRSSTSKAPCARRATLSALLRKLVGDSQSPDRLRSTQHSPPRQPLLLDHELGPQPPTSTRRSRNSRRAAGAGRAEQFPATALPERQSAAGLDRGRADAQRSSSSRFQPRSRGAYQRAVGRPWIDAEGRSSSKAPATRGRSIRRRRMNWLKDVISTTGREQTQSSPRVTRNHRQDQTNIDRISDVARQSRRGASFTLGERSAARCAPR